MPVRSKLLMPGVIPAELWVESGRWEQVRSRAAAHQGSPRTRFLPRADARRSDHRHRAQRAQELPPAAGELLPDPDEVPRRAPAAFRRDARARIPHEGRVLVPPRPEVAAGRATTPCTRRTPRSSRGSASSSARWSPTPAPSAAAAPRNSTCSPTPAKTPSRSPTATTTPPTSRWPWRCRQPRRARAASAALDRSRHAGREDHRGSHARCSNYPPRSWSRPCWSTAPTAAWSRCWCAAITS